VLPIGVSDGELAPDEAPAIFVLADPPPGVEDGDAGACVS
jgi:hypothetical protein|tara:strand:- start:8666 stop:8785 length:120 start_codon:yes stop_codon:yes gene_type:complete